MVFEQRALAVQAIEPIDAASLPGVGKIPYH
jgi:hypothetical protein